MIKRKAIIAAVALCAISTVGFADGGAGVAGTSKQNPSATNDDMPIKQNASVMNGDMPIVKDDHDHVKGVVQSIETVQHPKGNKMNMVVRTEDGRDVQVTVSEPNATGNGKVSIGDRVSVHGRNVQCNGNSMLRCEKIQRDGTVNLNQAVKPS